ncbi:MAG TPA: hypothetical protein VG125_11895 [Pirellulales bacterium]|jgi:hypothetical protein|nr:hypothetical protein [Pirellulales bacterium]
MPLPEFDPTEQYMLRYLKTASGHPGAYTMTYLTCGTLMTGFGFYLGSAGLMLTAMLTVLGFKAYEEWYSAKLMPVWRSIIEKV